MATLALVTHLAGAYSFFELACDTTQLQRDTQVNETLSLLRSQGYRITEGKFKVFESTKFGANPGNPYVMYFLTPTLSRGIFPDFKLNDSRDAFLSVSCTPPPVRYFSYRSYLFLDGALPVPFASLGDTMNNLVINTTGGDATVFNRTAAIITTGDETTGKHVAAALSFAGLGAATNFDLFSPATIASIEKADFVFLHRGSIWGSEEEKKSYFAQTRRVYRISPQPDRLANPVGPLTYRTRGTGASEMAAIPDFDAMLVVLRDGVVKSVQSLGYTMLYQNHTTNRYLYGDLCIQEHLQCLGDNHDTNYITSPNFNLSNTDRFVFYGTNCVVNGKCTYSNIGIYANVTYHLGRNFTASSSPLSIDDRAFVGSASYFAPSLPKSVADRFFAFAVARDCEGSKFCISVGEGILPLNREWLGVYRTVLEPATKTGPLASEVFLPRILHFGPPLE